jgi:hypothetical protein
VRKRRTKDIGSSGQFQALAGFFAQITFEDLS